MFACGRTGAGTVSVSNTRRAHEQPGLKPKLQGFGFGGMRVICAAGWAGWLEVGFTKIRISDKHDGSPTSGFETFADDANRRVSGSCPRRQPTAIVNLSHPADVREKLEHIRNTR